MRWWLAAVVLLMFPLVASCDEPRNVPPTDKEIVDATLSSLTLRVGELEGQVEDQAAQIAELAELVDQLEFLVADMVKRQSAMPNVRVSNNCASQPPPPGWKKWKWDDGEQPAMHTDKIYDDCREYPELKPLAKRLVADGVFTRDEWHYIWLPACRKVEAERLKARLEE